MTSEKLIKIREQEQRNAAETLGVKEVIFLGYPDQGLEDTTEFRKRLVRLIRQYRPETVRPATLTGAISGTAITVSAAW